MTDPASILAALQTFCVPGQVVELRALGVQGRRAVCQTFADLTAAAEWATRMDEAQASGCYFTPNPLRPERLGATDTLKADGVLCRHWLLIDVDPCRPVHTGSTAEEHNRACEVMAHCKASLDGAGLRGGLTADSGNGWHLCYPVELPNDDAAQELIRSSLRALQERCGDQLTDEEKVTIKARQPLATPKATIGVECHDAGRIWKMPGTHARKGPPNPERPHRLAKLVEGPAWNAETAQHNTALLPRALAALLDTFADLDQFSGGFRLGGSPSREESYAREALRLECLKVQGTAVGTGLNAQLNTSGFAVGRYVQPGLLTYEEASNALYLAALQAGANDPRKDKGTINRGLKAGKQQPWDRQLNEQRAAPGDSFSAYQAAGKEKETSAGFPAPIPASKLRASEKAPWLWEGFISRGGITLLSALWKSGKTTLLASMLKVMETGGQFCGKTIAPGRVLFVTEESESRWAERRDRLGLKDHVEFLVRPFVGKPKWETWGAFLAYTADLIQRSTYDLIVFDPLANLWPVRDENDAAQVTSALMPLHQVADRSSVLLVHHNRKGDGTEATASRGSGALTAFVDTIVELRRYAPEDQTNRCRVLTGYGRDEDTVQEIVVELGDSGEYRMQGTRRQVKALETDDILRRLLPADGPGRTFAELMDAWPEDQPKPNRKRCFNALKEGAEAGLWCREGAGVKGNPHTYWLPSANGTPVAVSPDSQV